MAAAGRLSVELATEASEREELLGCIPGRRGKELGPSCIDRRGGAGERTRLGEGEGVGSRDCTEKRSSHIALLKVYRIANGNLLTGHLQRVQHVIREELAALASRFSVATALGILSSTEGLACAHHDLPFSATTPHPPRRPPPLPHTSPPSLDNMAEPNNDAQVRTPSILIRAICRFCGRP